MNKIFNINEYIYPVSFVEKGIIDFSEVAQIKYDNGKLDISGDNEEDINLTFNEFINYITGMINEA